MPVQFLTDEQAAAYGRYTRPPSRSERERFFFLDDVDRTLVGRCRGDHNRLGSPSSSALSDSLGTFLADPLGVPTAGVAYVAEQSWMADPSVFRRYGERRQTQDEHASESTRSTVTGTTWRLPTSSGRF